MTGNPTIVTCEVGRFSVRPPLATGFDRPAFTLGEPINKAGEMLTMSDGARWFHPFDGSAPARVS